MMRALVFYLYSNNNAGDMAICMGAIDVLKRAGYSITFVSRYTENDPEFEQSKQYVRSYHPDVRVEPGIFSINRGGSAISKMASYAYGMARCALPVKDSRLTRLIRESELVAFNGGNLLRCAGFTDAARLFALFYPIEIARRLGKRIVCLPQSTADSSSWGLRLLGRKLALFDAVGVREGLSFDRLRSDYPKLPFYRTIDLAFFINLDHRRRLAGDERFVGRIALVLRGTGIGDIGQLDSGRVDAMFEGVRSFVLSRPHERFVLVVQTKKDRELSDRFKDTCPDADLLLVEEHDPIRLLAIYERCAALITMRLHAGILAIRAGIPVVGFFDASWGLKNKGLMLDFDMGYAEQPEELPAAYESLMDRYSELDPEGHIERCEQELAARLQA